MIHKKGGLKSIGLLGKLKGKLSKFQRGVSIADEKLNEKDFNAALKWAKEHNKYARGNIPGIRPDAGHVPKVRGPYELPEKVKPPNNALVIKSENGSQSKEKSFMQDIEKTPKIDEDVEIIHPDEISKIIEEHSLKFDLAEYKEFYSDWERLKRLQEDEIKELEEVGKRMEENPLVGTDHRKRKYLEGTTASRREAIEDLENLLRLKVIKLNELLTNTRQ